MKKIMSVLLCMMLAGGTLGMTAGAAAAGLSVGKITSVTISGDDAYTTPTQATSAAPDVLDAVAILLDSARSTATKPAGATAIAQLLVESSTGSHRFTLLQSGDRYLLGKEGDYRTVEYSVFNEVINTVGSRQFYRYALPPDLSITVDGKTQHLTLWDAFYTYRRISGKSTKVENWQLTEMPSLVAQGGKLFLPQGLDSGEVEVLREKEALWKGSLEKAAGYTLPGDGSYTVHITTQYSSPHYSGWGTYAYTLTKGAVPVQFSVGGASTNPGEVVVLRVKGVPAGAKISVTTDLNLTPTFFDHPQGGRIALLPVSYFTAVGEHWVTMSYGDHKQSFTIFAEDKKFQIQNLAVSQSTTEETIRSEKANAEYEKYIAPLRFVADSKQHWNGRFILPVSDSNITTQFGMIRYLNGAPTSSRHGALDMAVPRGTPVAVTGSGRVLFASMLQLTGNTVLVEHGFGLKSWYYHMDSLKVATGDQVTQGQIIGTVGTTGFSTGPHLHFGMSVNNVFVNPYTLIKTDLLA